MPAHSLGRQDLLRTGSRVLGWNNHSAGEYAKGRYGRFWGQCLVAFTEATVERLARLEQDVINGGEKEFLYFKESLTGELSMIAVAGAILAQIAVTTFSLPDVADVHWVTRGFFACALIMGVLSVQFAVLQQRTMGNLYTASQIRTWLLADRHASFGPNMKDLRNEKYKVSFSAAFLTQVPYTMIEYGAAFLIVGLGLYFGYAWKNSLDTEVGGLDNRNVFITYIACSGVLIMQWAWAFFSKSIWLEPKPLLSDSETAYQEPNPNPNSHNVRIVHENCQTLGKDIIRTSPFSTGPNALVEALREAAKLHRQCAEADLVVAAQYELEAERSK